MAVVTGSSKQNGAGDDLEELARQFGVRAGVPRHLETGIRTAQSAEIRSDDTEEDSIGTLYGHFCVFNRWTEINSFFEGRFLEQIAPGACKKTFSENRQGMRCLFQHGRDPQVGMKPLGPIRELEEDNKGGRYVVPLSDSTYNRDLLPGLKGGLYGASFRFQVMREEVVAEPPRSDFNPDGIEERTITEMKVREFGPVTFPAYEDATAGVRSLNDWWLDLDLELFARAHPDAYPARLAELLLNLRSEKKLTKKDKKRKDKKGKRAEEPVVETTIETEQPESAEEERESAETESETAPPSGAPESTKLTTTRLPGAARKPLRTSREKEEPSWKL